MFWRFPLKVLDASWYLDDFTSRILVSSEITLLLYFCDAFLSSVPDVLAFSYLPYILHIERDCRMTYLGLFFGLYGCI